MLMSLWWLLNERFTCFDSINIKLTGKGALLRVTDKCIHLFPSKDPSELFNELLDF